MGLINEHDETTKMLNLLREFSEPQQEVQGGINSVDADENDVTDQNESLKNFIPDGIINNITIHKDTQGVGIGATVYGTITSMGGLQWTLSLNEPEVSNGVKITQNSAGFDINDTTLDKLRKLDGWGRNFPNEFSEILVANYGSGKTENQ